MSIKQNGGVFGRNPTFNDVTIEGDLIINGEVFTGLDFQGSWNASTNSPTLASSVGTNGEFYIVSVAGGTNLNGITNWGIGDWAIFNGTAWQRVEGGADGNFNDVTVAGTLGVTGEITANGGIALGNNDKATFGAGDDLQIYHTGSQNYIEDAGTGNLNFKSNGNFYNFLDGSNATVFQIDLDDATRLYHNTAQKLATTSTGIDVTGTATMDGLTVTGTIGNFAVDTQGAIATFSRPSTSYIRASDVSGSLRFDAGGSLARLNIASNGDISFYEDTGTTPKLFWDASAESLGIGTSSPAASLDVHGSDVFSIRSLRNTGNGGLSNTDTAGGIRLGTSNGTTGYVGAAINIQAPTTWVAGSSQPADLRFFTVPDSSTTLTERMRIDSSGNLLVGKSAINTDSVGFEARAIGLNAMVRDGGETLVLGRNTSDGSILSFRKDGTAVGSIGADSGDLTIYGTVAGHTGFRFGNGEVYPTNNGGSLSDNTMSLGSTSVRFKDLYLSGGVYLGGTAAANLLDDYETGTFTPTVGGTWTTDPTALTGRYIKVGNFVWIEAKMTGGTKASAVSGYLSGLPFSTNTSFGGTGVVVDSGVTAHGSCLFQNTDRIWLTDTAFGTGTVYVTGGYEIA